MTVGTLGRREIVALSVTAAVCLTVYFWPSGAPAVVEATPASIPAAERRLERLRQIAGTVPGKKKVAEELAGQTAELDKALLTGDTAAQAQANLLQIVRRLAREQSPPIDIGAAEIGTVKGMGRDYGETEVSVTTQCRIEQMVQLLADLSAQPELIATRELRVSALDQKQKTMTVRLTVSGMLPRRHVPEKKGGLF